MNINLAELAQHEAAWLAYGKRRASRLVWRKATNADIAANLDVALLAQKIEAHDKRILIVRAAARLFTDIQRQRELLVYRLGNDLFVAIKASPTVATLVAQQANIDKITVHVAHASRFSWFKKPLSAFIGWVKQKVGSVIVVAAPQAPQPNLVAEDPRAIRQSNVPEAILPVELNTETARERFRQNVVDNKRALVSLYRQCESEFLSITTTAEKVEKFESCFQPFKKKLRELQLYYHTDKVTDEKARAVGFDCETFRVEAECAFKDIQPLIESVVSQRDGIKGFFEHDLAFEARLAAIAEGIRRLEEANLRFDGRLAELQAANARQGVALSIIGDGIVVLSKKLDALGGAIETVSCQAAEAERKARETDRSISALQKSIGVLMSLTASDNQLQFSVNALENSVVTSPLTSSAPSTNPSAFFAVVGGAGVVTSDDATPAPTSNCSGLT